MILDEMQNSTAMQAFSIVSRAGVGSKVILMGDPYQIGNPRLDASTCGISFTAERMKLSNKIHAAEGTDAFVPGARVRKKRF